MTESRIPIRTLLHPQGERSTYQTVVNALFVLSVLFLLCVGIASAAMGAIKADQVGVLINNVTGQVTKVDPGTCFYNSIISDLYVIDRSQQTIEMKQTRRRVAGQARPSDDEDASDEVGAVKIKTVDGSDVSADIIVNYVMNADDVVAIVEHSGPKDAYKDKWAKDYARSFCRNVLGELTTEEFYDSGKRDEKAKASMAELNRVLKPWGLRVTAVQVQDFGFYHEYEEKIREKKLADQEVEEQKSQAKAALERKKRIEIEEASKVIVELAQSRGEMQKRRVLAEAEANKARVGADAYAYATKVGADARFYQSDKRAQGVLATKRAEADALQQMARALEGGRNLVLFEYAKKLKTMHLTGQPTVIDSRMERLQHFGGAAAGPHVVGPQAEPPEGEGGESPGDSGGVVPASPAPAAGEVGQ